MREYDLWIDGKAVPATRAATLVTKNPANGEPVATVARASARDARRAIEAARRAADTGGWRDLAPRERAARLAGVAELLFERQAEIADLDVAETGLPIKLAYELVAGAIANLQATIAAARDLRAVDADPESGALVVRRPFGVVGLGVGDDAPFARTLAWITDALIAGNTLVVRPPALACSSVMEIASAIAESDVPPGVVNVLSGAGVDVDDEIASNAFVDRIAFATTAASARRMGTRAAETSKPAHLHVASGAAAIVLADADLDRAVPGLLWGAMLAAGRTPAHLARVIVDASVAEPLAYHLARGVAALRVGDPTDFATAIGPLSSAAEVVAYERAIALALREGGRNLVDPAPPPGPAYAAPAVVSSSSSARIAWDGVNGPALTLIPFYDESEAIEIANRPPRRSAVSVWSRDVTRALTIARTLDADLVWLNDHTPARVAGDGIVLSDTPASPWERRASVTTATLSLREDRRFGLLGLDSVFGFD